MVPPLAGDEEFEPASGRFDAGICPRPLAFAASTPANPFALAPRWDSVCHTHPNVYNVSVNYLCIPFAEQFEQTSGVAHCVNGIPFISRPESIFKPIGEAWV